MSNQTDAADNLTELWTLRTTDVLKVYQHTFESSEDLINADQHLSTTAFQREYNVHRHVTQFICWGSVADTKSLGVSQ